MKKKNNIMLGIIIAIIILLIGIICAVLVIAKSKENLDKDNKSTSTSISTSTTTSKIKKTTTGVKINTNIPEGYKLIDKSDIDYSKKLEGQHGFNMVPIEKTKYKEFNLADFEKEYDTLLIKRDGNKLNIYDNFRNNKKLILTISDFSKLLYGVSGYQCDEYTFISYNNDNSIKIYQLNNPGCFSFDVENVEEVSIDEPNAKLYVEGYYSEGLYNLFLKKDNGDYYNLKYNATYGAETIKNAIWFSTYYHFYVTKENEVYFLGNKVDGVKYLASAYDNCGVGGFYGLISSDYNFYFINYDNNTMKSEKIKNLYYKTSEHDSNDYNILIETEGNPAYYDDYECDVLGDINYFNFDKR